MDGGESWQFLGELLLLLGGAVAAGAALEAIGVSAIIGYLLAGVVLGPGLTGIITDVESFELVAELGVALLTMVEATQHADGVGARPWGGLPRPRARHLSGHDDDPDDDDDELFRRMIASSANFAGDRSGDRSDAEWSDEMDAEVLQTGVGEDGPVDSTGPGAYQMGAPRPVDTVHYNLVIAACAAARRWQDSLELLLRMREGGVPRDTVTYNSVIHSLSRGGRWRLALKLFKQMRRDDVPPDTRTFATVISACANAGEWQPSP